MKLLFFLIRNSLFQFKHAQHISYLTLGFNRISQKVISLQNQVLGSALVSNKFKSYQFSPHELHIKSRPKVIPT